MTDILGIYMSSGSLLQIAELLRNYPISFVQDIPDGLKCTICEKILRNAKQTSCGCRVCEECIINYLGEGEKPCPSKQAECAYTKLMIKRDILQDNATNRKIANLKAKCPFTNCNVKDSLKNLVLHINNCRHRTEFNTVFTEVCQVKCEKCGKMYPYKETMGHISHDCDQRMVKCKFCNHIMTNLILRSEHLNENHLSLCHKYMGDCSNGCGAKNVNLKEHLKNCTNKKVECPFRSLNCNAGKLTSKALATHLNEESISHFGELVTMVTKLKEGNNVLSNDVNRLQSLLKEQMEIRRKETNIQQKMEKNIEELKKKSGAIGVPSSLPERNVISRNAGFIWKITNYSTLKQDAETGGRASVTSDPFYTSEFGYKMCLKIYPAGDGVGRGTHLSVFFAIMKGEYDDLLAWPFKQKVTLSLIDQENGGVKNHSDTFKPDARSACYQKPVDEYNIASGSPKFILLSSLIPTSMYCKNDTLFLKIAVDTIGISRP